jgi:hypothetical protein
VANYALISSSVILVVNILLSKVAEPLVSLIGTNEMTQERNLTSITIFFIFLINTCVVPILLQANFSADYKDSFMDSSFSAGGRNSDFGAYWYQDIGNQLLICTLILSVQPLIILFLEVIWLKLDRYYKRNYSYKNHDNNHTDNIKFLEINVGPEYPF